MIHHLCIYDDYCTFDGEMIPIGKFLIEKEITKAISDVLDMMVHTIGTDDVYVCGTGDARRMLGRKLEDRLGREVIYDK
ncbi:MAG: hypothetical protein RLZZ308_686 [Candidatus Parcubacteria bacterium]|jgi:hypothetical protein